MAIGINGTSNTITGLAVGGLPDGTVDADTLATNAVSTAKIEDTAVTLAKLEHGTGSNDGKFLRANNGADPTFETVNTDLVGDTSPQLGGDLDCNGNNIAVDGGNNITIGDSGRLRLGASNDLDLFHDGTDNHITGGSTINVDTGAGETMAKFITNGAVELYHDNVKKLETVSGGATITGTCTATAFAGDGSSLTGIAGIPSGVIVMWSGATSAIPTGYVLCDGNNSTPDLRDRFVVGASDSTGDNSYPGVSPGATGGAASVNAVLGSVVVYTGTEDNPNQVQSASSSINGINNKQSNDRHQHGVDLNHTHSGIATMPPYYALAYIMKS